MSISFLSGVQFQYRSNKPYSLDPEKDRGEVVIWDSMYY